MNQQSHRTMQATTTALTPGDALAAAKRFFSSRSSVYTAYLEREGPAYATFRGQGGEEIVVGVRTVDGATEVTGSSYMFDQQVARFLSSLPPAAAAAV
jgi:hypothetical protein